MPQNSPNILLIMEDGDEAHTVHVLTKYHFANSLQKIRRPDDARRHLAQLATSGAVLPELILVSLSAPALIPVLAEARRGRVAEVPLVVVAGAREMESGVAGFPNTYVMGKPLGFFKLLEAMQKLGMYWLALRSPPA